MNSKKLTPNWQPTPIVAATAHDIYDEYIPDDYPDFSHDYEVDSNASEAPNQYSETTTEEAAVNHNDPFTVRFIQSYPSLDENEQTDDYLTNESFGYKYFILYKNIFPIRSALQ